jgi:hypothetical protein
MRRRIEVCVEDVEDEVTGEDGLDDTSWEIMREYAYTDETMLSNTIK